MSDQIIYIRLPQQIIEIVDAAVSAKLYKDRAEALRECIRNGVKGLLRVNKNYQFGEGETMEG